MTIKRVIVGVLMLVLCGCSFQICDDIAVVSREDGSGTRSAFAELIGIEKDGVESITEYAEVTNSTAVMIASVAGYKNAIGYVSVGSLSDSVKTIKIDGVSPTKEKIKSGEYPVARNFNIVTTESVSALAQDFIKFMLSPEGQKIVEDGGYTSVQPEEQYQGEGTSGKISIAGSTSVAPVMEMLADAYREINPNVTIEIQQTGSSAGIMAVKESVADIGLSSRELSDKELKSNLQVTTIALDGIAVIVNLSNNIDSLTTEQVRKIFSREIEKWADVDYQMGDKVIE